MIQRDVLQRLLREFGGPLAQAEVKAQSDVVFTPPHEAKISFLANVNGRPELVEVELDLRSVSDASGVARLAGKILSALEQRAAAA